MAETINPRYVGPGLLFCFAGRGDDGLVKMNSEQWKAAYFEGLPLFIDLRLSSTLLFLEIP